LTLRSVVIDLRTIIAVLQLRCPARARVSQCDGLPLGVRKITSGGIAGGRFARLAHLLWLPLCIASFAGALDAPPSSHHGVFVAVGDGGVIVRSTDEGATWTAVTNTGTKRDLSDVIAVTGGVLVADGDGGTIVRSVDSGASWLSAHRTGSTSDLGQATAEPNGTLLVNGDGTVVRSVDGGLNWSAAHKTGTSTQFQTLIAEPHGALVALCDQGIVVRSTDDGLTWSVVVSRHAVFQGVAVTQKGTLVVAGGQDATRDSPQSAVILRSVDGGSHWLEVTGINSRDWLLSVTAESGGVIDRIRPIRRGVQVHG
jgi:hypothetical protein